MTEKEKMLRGELYNATDPQLTQERRIARALTGALNQSRDDQADLRRRIIAELFGAVGGQVVIEPPFYCDYGSNIFIGRNVFFNFNCVILDPARVDIGDNVLFGPGVQVYTATHPMDPQTRRSGLELARPVRIGSDVWLGGGAIINPGVTVGDGSVIGSGSVVTRDVPVGVFAAGNPCRVIRHQ
jgi:maltose O-acetyltransferase